MQKDSSSDVYLSVEVHSSLRFNSSDPGRWHLFPSVTVSRRVPKYQIAAEISSVVERGDDQIEYALRYSVTTVSKSCQVVDKLFVKFIEGGSREVASRERFHPIKKFSVGQSGVWSCKSREQTTFRIYDLFYIRGVHENYSYELCDSLMKEEMQRTVGNLGMADVEFLVSDRSIWAHKAIVCARSPVFSAMFATEMRESATGRVKIDDVTPKVFRQFLQFLYTGSLGTSFYNNRQLAYCADKYQVDTLIALCQNSSLRPNSTALKRSISESGDHLTSGYDLDFLFRLFLLITSLFPCRERGAWSKEPRVIEESFVHQFTWESASNVRREFVFRNVVLEVILRDKMSLLLYCWNPNSIGLEVLRVEYLIDNGSTWDPMDRCECCSACDDEKPPTGLDGFPHFNAKAAFPAGCRIDFRVSFTETDDSFTFTLMDRLRGPQLWQAAKSGQFTDMEFVVGSKSMMAHKVVLGARSPYFARMFHSDKYPFDKCFICDFDFIIFEQLLYFMYTGCLLGPADNENLLEAAVKYEMETLQKICTRALETSLEFVTEDDLILLDIMLK